MFPISASSESPEDPAAQALVRSLLEFRRAGFRNHAPGELGHTEFALLVALHHEACPTGLRISDLARRLGSSPPTMTQTTSSLARLGLIDRVADPEDRRGVRIVLTEAGSEVVRNRHQQFLAYCSRLAAHLGASEALQLADLLSKTARFFQTDAVQSSKESSS